MSEEDRRGGDRPEAYTPEEDRQHREGIQRIHDGIKSGLGFDEACDRLDVADESLRRIIVSDYLKVTIAERHFRDKASLEEVAGELGVPEEKVVEVKGEMLSEVAAASVKVFRDKYSGEGPPPEEQN